MRNESPVQVRCMIQCAQGWCTGMTQMDGMGREVGAGVQDGELMYTHVCCCCVALVVSDSARPHRWQPNRLPVPGILQARTLE